MDFGCKIVFGEEGVGIGFYIKEKNKLSTAEAEDPTSSTILKTGVLKNSKTIFLSQNNRSAYYMVLMCSGRHQRTKDLSNSEKKITKFK